MTDPSDQGSDRGGFEPTELAGNASSPGDGETIDSYRLLELLGQGGMGEVWLAEQIRPVRRKVALKIIKRGMDTEQVVARFEVERQALALMDHPSVARVFDAGATARGRPYFVMEYVKGVPITEHCDRWKLSMSDRLELFIQVCAGVQHAHQKAIIHRDLKPSNVLVTIQDGSAVPKIIDFGVAKATARRMTDRTMHTQLGELIGTPEYMSPEQADFTAQDVDTRTDVYALGVMLYELLTGALPFESDELRRHGFEGIVRTIRDAEPSKPSARLSTLGERSTESAKLRRTDLSSLRRELSGELDWITMEAMEKDRTRRYGSPTELAADIRRYLEHQPVLAGPPSTLYRARKFVRRHTVGVGFAIAAIVLLAAFAVSMTWQAKRTARERDRADRQARIAGRALGFVTELFEVSDPSEARGNSITAREILDRGAQRLERELVSEPEVHARMALTMGRVYRNLGLYDAAAPLLERSLRLRQDAIGLDSTDTLESAGDVAALLRLQGKLEEAERYSRQALEGRQRILGQDHPRTLESLGELGLVLQEQGKLQEAENYYGEALNGFRRVLGSDHPDTLEAINHMGFLRWSQGRHAQGEALVREALQGRRRVLGDDHPKTLFSVNSVGFLLLAQGKAAEAEPFYREALEGRRRVLGNKHQDTLISLNNMGYLMGVRGKLDDAERYYREAYGTSLAALGQHHPQTLNILTNLGDLHIRQGRLDDAEEVLARAVADARQFLPAGHRATGKALHSYGRCLARGNRVDDAEKMLKDAYDILAEADAKLARIVEEELAALLASQKNLARDHTR